MAGAITRDLAAKRPSAGAWKVVMIRPDKNDPEWSFVSQLETILFQCKAADSKKVFEILNEMRVIDKLYTEEGSSETSKQKREAFRQMIQNDPNQGLPDSDTLSEFIATLLQQERTQSDGAFSGPVDLQKVVTAVREVFIKHWHLWDVAQILNFRRVGSETYDSELKKLLARQ
jgi:hypothetical protein